LRVQSLMIEGLGLRVYGPRFWFKVWGVVFSIKGLVFRFQCFECVAEVSGFSHGLGFRVEGVGIRVSGFRVWGLDLADSDEDRNDQRRVDHEHRLRTRAVYSRAVYSRVVYSRAADLRSIYSRANP